MAADSPLLRLVHVTKRYASAAGVETLAVLDGITLDLNAAESMAIVGPSGSGKSTLLNLIGTLDRPSDGQILLEGRDLAALDDAALAQVRNRELGFVFQAHHLLPQCTVLENVLVPTLVVDDSTLRREAPDRARRLLDKVGLGERLAHRPGRLSGGERQRVAVVRALINQPKLLLADEPTGALDHRSAQHLGQLLVDLNRDEGVTLILVTHALDLARRMGRVLELRGGKLEPLASGG